MIAIHSNWTKPFYTKKDLNTEYRVEDFDIITTILSALTWRRYNGSIKMVTDNMGLEYYKKLGITDIWDLGVDTSLESMRISPDLFWSVGKIYALKSQPSPCVIMDTDFIVWEKIEEEWWNHKLAGIHAEPTVFTKEFFNMKPGYVFDPQWDWNITPFNAGFMFFNDKEFVTYYLDEVIKFMKNVEPDNKKNLCTSFADQYFLAMCAKQKGIEIKAFMELEKAREQKRFTHIWMYKTIIRINPVIRKNFCFKFLKRIITEFPEYKDMIYHIEMFNVYLRDGDML
jgi:hypothetical protein